MGRNLSEDLFFCSSPDFGRKMGRNLSVTISNSDLCLSQFSEVSGPSFFKILRTLLEGVDYWYGMSLIKIGIVLEGNLSLGAIIMALHFEKLIVSLLADDHC